MRWHDADALYWMTSTGISDVDWNVILLLIGMDINGGKFVREKSHRKGKKKWNGIWDWTHDLEFARPACYQLATKIVLIIRITKLRFFRHIKKFSRLPFLCNITNLLFFISFFFLSSVTCFAVFWGGRTTDFAERGALTWSEHDREKKSK